MAIPLRRLLFCASIAPWGAGAGLGCSHSTSAPEPGAVAESIAPSAPPAAPREDPLAPSGAVRRELAFAGYYGEVEGRRVWTEAHATCPGVLDGREMIGRAMPSWDLEQWLDGRERTLESLRGRVVVVRFWTAPGCPFCEKTLPALAALSKELENEPVTFVGAFHSKPIEAYRTLERPGEVVREWGIEFPIALDPEWKTLQKWWYAAGAHRHASSVTFVIGKDGKLLHVHPGPVFHPSDDPAEAEENDDYLAVRAAIRAGLEAR